MFNWFGGKKKTLELKAPMAGRVLTLDEVPDQVFSARMLGDGFAVDPTGDRVVAPCAGRVSQIFPTSHAVGLETEEGLEILIHVGIDTVELKGQGFTRLVEAGVRVTAGTPLLAIDTAYISAQGKSLITPVIVTNMDKVQTLDVHTHTNLEAGAGPAASLTMK